MTPNPPAPMSNYNVPSKVTVTHQQVTAMRRQGPIPEAEEMAAYGQIDPSLPGRIVAMAERAQEHRQEMERKELELAEYDVRQVRTAQKRGQVFGLCVVLAGLAAACYATYLGAHPVAIAFGTVTIIGIAVVFVLNRKPGNTSSGSVEPADP
jgi:uncharacterized membrane protein